MGQALSRWGLLTRQSVRPRENRNSATDGLYDPRKVPGLRGWVSSPVSHVGETVELVLRLLRWQECGGLFAYLAPARAKC